VTTAYVCTEDRRRAAIGSAAGVNGIDFLEVVDDKSQPASEQERTLIVHLFHSAAGAGLSPGNVLIGGGDRITGIVATALGVGAAPNDNVVTITVSAAGDYSAYTLGLYADAEKARLGTDLSRPAGFDPVLSSIEFSFKVLCPSDFDCRRTTVCPPPVFDPVSIDYLAKDYASFRRLMLDRITTLVPSWQERNVADLGVRLVELLAYVGDYLSYRQDGAATEAYLATARSRVSLRRHARLVDYRVDEGRNARVWLCLTVSAAVTVPGATPFCTRIASAGARVDPLSDAYRLAIEGDTQVFETLDDLNAEPSHGEIPFYTWGGSQCCLPRGATSATLIRPAKDLLAGQLLLLEEKRGPVTGDPADADPAHRQVVRLTAVRDVQDPLGHAFLADPLAAVPDLVEITWHDDDALAFALTISTTIDTGAQRTVLEDVSVAHGNVVLADHGRTERDVSLGVVPNDTLVAMPSRTTIPARYRPTLPFADPTFAPRYAAGPSASATFAGDAAAAQPSRMALTGTTPDQVAHPWTPLPDLLNPGVPGFAGFVVEVESDGTASLRFGDGLANGARPAPGTAFALDLRVGNGIAGNVPAESVVHLVAAAGGPLAVITGVRNPLPARDGRERESSGSIRARAPSAFRTQLRAVTADDYARFALQVPSVRAAAATFRWTGSWLTVFLTAVREGDVPLDDAFRAQLEAYLETYRMAGHDLEVEAPVYVALDLSLLVCVEDGASRSDVETAILDLLSSRTLPDGRRGAFHPDAFSLGAPVYLAPVVALVMTVPGVASVVVRSFKNAVTGVDARATGVLHFNRLEMPRLANDPDFPDRGTIALTLDGGR
jgi:hypothetical protein